MVVSLQSAEAGEGEWKRSQVGTRHGASNLGQLDRRVVVDGQPESFRRRGLAGGKDQRLLVIQVGAQRQRVRPDPQHVPRQIDPVGASAIVVLVHLDRRNGLAIQVHDDVGTPRVDSIGE